MKQAHVFRKEGKLYLIPELPKEPKPVENWKTKGGLEVNVGGDFGFTKAMLKYNEALAAAKANALPVVNPEIIDRVRELYGWFTYTTEGKLYEWPGTWEMIPYDCYEKIAAELIAPQQNAAHGYTEGAEVPQQAQADKQRLYTATEVRDIVNKFDYWQEYFRRTGWSSERSVAEWLDKYVPK